MDIPKQPKVLYIEDMPEARSLVRRVLTPDFLVLDASDPLTGIELAIDSQPDLILLDINLPHLSGREVATRLKKLLPKAVLVAFSADVTSDARERALAAGCVGYITKPLDVDTFPELLWEFLKGKREIIANPQQYHELFEDELVQRLEEKVRELTKTAERNAFLNEQNQRLVAVLSRRQRFLEAAARVGRVVTSILDLDELLKVTVDVICEQYGFYYAGIFLIDPKGEWALMRAGRGEAGTALLAEGHRLAVGGRSMVGHAISQRKARVSLDVVAEENHFKNPHLPLTRSEIDLPLIVQEEVLGALSVQSEQMNAFVAEDITSLEALADQVAIAINNARLVREVAKTNHELLRTKTFEAIAQTTGETIHWVGNKATPIPGSARRVREDLIQLLAIFQALLERAGKADPLPDAVLSELAEAAFANARQQGIDLPAVAAQLAQLTPRQRQALGGLDSILEDLTIIEQSATSILHIKENLIGPIRLQHAEPICLPDLLNQVIFEMGLPAGVVHTDFEMGLPIINGDTRQLSQVYNNLIKNAWEALEQVPKPSISVKACRAEDPRYILTQVSDNGPGIPAQILDKIWVSFFTTKGHRGGTGLGLSACIAIVNQMEGKISVESQVGAGSTFTVLLPIESTVIDHE